MHVQAIEQGLLLGAWLINGVWYKWMHVQATEQWLLLGAWLINGVWYSMFKLHVHVYMQWTVACALYMQWTVTCTCIHAVDSYMYSIKCVIIL